MPTVTSAPGLITALNEAEAPEGSLLRADNCVIKSKDVIEPRRGFTYLDYVYGGTPTGSNSPQRAKQGFFYQDKLHVLYDQIAAPVTSKLAYDTGSSFSDYSGSYYGADEALMRLKTVSFRNNLYMTTTNGVYKISNVGNTPRTAGVPQALGTANRTTGNVAAIGNGWVSRTSNVVSVTYALNPVSLVPPPVLGSSDPVGFVVGETVLCTSTDVNFPSGSKIVVTSNLNAGTGGFSVNRGIFTYNEAGANASTTIVSGVSVTYQTQTLLDAAGFLADGNHCAYRFVLDLPDNNQQILLGPPSDKYEVANVNGTVGWVTTQSKNVQLKIRLPSGLPTNARLWVYRTEQVPTTIPTGEEFYKIYEYAITSYDLSTRVVIIKDIVIDSWLTEPLYTSPSQETALSANFEPPFAKDIASWSNRVWYANTKSNYSKTFRIIGEIPSGTRFLWGTGNTLEYVRGLTVAANVNVTTDFFIPTTGSTSQRLETTARNLVEAINRNSSLVDAFYDEDEATGIGFVRLESKTNSPFSVACYVVGSNVRTLIDPVLPLYPQLSSGSGFSRTAQLTRDANGVVTGEVFGITNEFLVGDSITVQAGVPNFGVGPFTITTVSPFFFTYNEPGIIATTAPSTVDITYSGPYTSGAAEQEAIVNRLFYSKQQQGEAVPLLNYLDVGAPGKQILRIIPLRERLYVFKEDGIFTVAGEYPFRVDLLDDTVRLIAADSCATVGNQIFCLTNQGVVSVGESGVAIVSRQIEKTIFDLIQDSIYNKEKTSVDWLPLSWGCGYETERNYMVRIGIDPNIYVYNYLNRVWTRWTRDQLWAIVHPSKDFLYAGAGPTVSENVRNVRIERKTLTAFSCDYADEKVSKIISATSGSDSLGRSTTISFSSGGNLPSVGDLIFSPGSYVPPGITELSDALYSEDLDLINVAIVTSLTGGVPFYNITFEYLGGSSAPGFVGGETLYIYRKYPVTLQWMALNGGGPALIKQFDEWSPVFNVRTFSNAQLKFAADSESNNVSQITTIDANPFFNDGRTVRKLDTARINPISKRVSVPRDQQRCTNLTVTFTINEACAYWRLLGFNYEAKPISPLANRKK